MDGGAWWAAVHGVTKSQIRLSDFTSLHFTSLLRTLPFPSKLVSTTPHSVYFFGPTGAEPNLGEPGKLYKW